MWNSLKSFRAAIGPLLVRANDFFFYLLTTAKTIRRKIRSDWLFSENFCQNRFRASTLKRDYLIAVSKKNTLHFHDTYTLLNRSASSLPIGIHVLTQISGRGTPRLRLAQGRHRRGAQRRIARQKASLREARKSDEMPRWGWSSHADLLKKWDKLTS